MSQTQALAATARRSFLAGAGLMAVAATNSSCGDDNQPGTAALVARIEREVVFPGRRTGTSWFHPRACMVGTSGDLYALMTLQSISGSDVFGPVHWTISKDLGKSWTDPRPIPGLGRRTLEGRREEGVCDVVPEFHAASGTVLAIGHNVYYERGVLARPQGPRWPVYVVQTSEGSWLTPQKLMWDDSRGASIYTCGCAQRVTQERGDILIPLSFGSKESQPRSVTTVRCTFDGRLLEVREVGSELTSRTGRGLLEPSLASLGGKYFMTIRAEDGRGYVATSDDGLQWTRQVPWMWDDGQPLAMSTTQQRWLVHSDALLLVYTRQDERNSQVMRWRAPLYVAQLERKSLRLLRDTERVALPLVGDPIGEPEHVALMGNFHTTAASPDESWVTVGENRRNDGWKGDTLLARVRWRRPNRLAGASTERQRLR